MPSVLASCRPNIKTRFVRCACPDPDAEMMLRVKRDEPGAFAELTRRFGSRIFAQLYRMIPDRQEAEDLTQDVFLRLYRARERYEPRARFATWLYHITQNVARNALRSRRRRPCARLNRMPGGDRDAFGDGILFDRGDAPSEPLERAELAGRVRAAVSELGERQRTALELHQFQDRTYAEVAEEMDMSPEAAKSLLYRARNQLRAHLGALVEA